MVYVVYFIRLLHGTSINEKVCLFQISCEYLSMFRIYTDCQLHSATGRVSLSEPNLQNVPKDFDIVLPDMIGESPPQVTPGGSRRTTRLQQMIGPRQVAMVTDGNNGTKFAVSMRNAFVPFQGDDHKHWIKNVYPFKDRTFYANLPQHKLADYS